VAPADDGVAVHYTALERGTPVWSSDGEEVGKVVEVLDNYREHIFDGLVIETTSGVTLTITAAECAGLGPPPSSQPAVGGALKRLLGRRR
jgi:hypothetical protein